MKRSRNILIVDDRPDKLASLVSELGTECVCKHPRDLSQRDLVRASIALVDQHLEADDWEDRDACPFACQPRNGSALAANIKSHLATNQKLTKRSPTAVCLLSAKLNELVLDVRYPLEALAAKAAAVDWAFDKIGKRPSGSTLANDIRSFADAVLTLGAAWPNDTKAAGELLAQKLRVPATHWRAVAIDQIARCRPPFDSHRLFTDQTAVLRWFCQRILPYPTFLVGIDHVACRFGVQSQWLERELENPRSHASRMLSRCEYAGPLARLLGRRWWAAGVTYLAVGASDGGTVGLSTVAMRLAKRSLNAANLSPKNAVPVLGPELSPEGLESMDVCVRLLPDDWPGFGEQAWAAVTTVKREPKLSSLVVAADRGRV